MTFRSKLLQRTPHLTRSSPTHGVNHLTNFETIKLTRSTNSVRAHVIKPKPVAHSQRTRQHGLFRDAVDGVAGRSPDAAQLFRLVLWDVEGAVHGQDVGVDYLVVEEDTVECAVDSVVDVV